VHLALRHLADDLAGPEHETLVAAFAAWPPRRMKFPQEARHDDGTRAEV